MLELIFFNTDLERFEILLSCCKQLRSQYSICDNFSEEQIGRIEKNYDIFEKIKNYNDFIEKEKQNREKEFSELFNKAKLYFTHYYQVLYMAIERGELPASVTNYYNLNFPFNIPNIDTPEHLIYMSEQLFKYDNIRIENGGKYFANPNIGSVKVWVEKFIEQYQEKTNRCNTKQAEIDNIDNIRYETDLLILEIFDVLEYSTIELNFDAKKEVFAKFGISIKEFCEEELINKNKINADMEQIIELTKKENSKKNSKKQNMNQLQFNLFFPE